MTDVTPSLKEKVECQCGCGLYGSPNKWGCIRLCKCNRCRGRRNRKKGLTKQREARKGLGVKPTKFGDSNEERWDDPFFENEVKAGKQIGPAWTAWQRIEKQIDANRPDFGGQHKPPRAVLMPDGYGDGLVMVRLSTWNEFVLPALEEVYGT